MSRQRGRGCGRGRAPVGAGPHDDRRPVPPPSLPARDHRPRRVALRPLPAQPANGRGDAARARDRRLLRDRSALGREVRPGARAGAAAAGAPAERRLAPRRGARGDPRPRSLALAGGRPARGGARRDPATPPRQARRAPPARPAPQEAGLAAAADRDRQAALVRRREAGGRAQPRAPRPQGAQQPGREQPWPPQKTGAANAGLPLAGGLQRFVSVFSATRNLFVPPARRRSALAIRYHRLEALDAWRQVAGLAA